MRFRLTQLFLFAALALASSAARADGRTSSLSWVRMPGADGCVATQELARDVEGRLGRAVFVSAAQADVSVEGHIEPNKGGPGFHAIVSLRDAKGALLGTRELTKKEPSCDEMRAPLALVIAVMIDPDAALHPKDPPPPPPPPPPPQQQQEPKVIVQEKTVYVEVPANDKPQTPPEKKATWETEVDLGFATSLGLLPSAGPGAAISAVVSPPRGPAFSIDGTYLFGTDANAERGAKLTVSGAMGSLGVCPIALRGEKYSVFACGAFGVGAFDAKPSGFDSQPDAKTRIIFMPEVDVRGSLRIVGPLRASMTLSGMVPTVRDSYVYDRADGTQPRIFQPSVLAGKAVAGLGVTF